MLLQTVSSCIRYLANCHLASNLWLVLLFEAVGVMYGLITSGTDLVLKGVPRVRAHLVGWTSDEESSRALAFHASSCIYHRMPFF